ncbi:hypothetical protein TNCV_3049411 [Trichonephila clavipes]|nr:hypothetical protein TNCV_3049411 [Trichonephila clavipes]
MVLKEKVAYSLFSDTLASDRVTGVNSSDSSSSLSVLLWSKAIISSSDRAPHTAIIVESELSGISNALATSTFLSPSSTDSITFYFSEIVKHLYFLKEDMLLLSRDKSTQRGLLSQYGGYDPRLVIDWVRVRISSKTWLNLLRESRSFAYNGFPSRKESSAPPFYG